MLKLIQMIKHRKSRLIMIVFSFILVSCDLSELDQEITTPELRPMPEQLITPSAVPTPIPTIDPAKILYQDDFSDPESSWLEESFDSGSTSYQNDGFVISLIQSGYYIWEVPGEDFTDVIIEVETTKISGGDDNYYGVTCRHQDSENFYAFFISSDGYAIQNQHTSDGLEDVTDAYIYSEYINQGTGVTNIIRAECIGARMSLYVNGHFITETFNSDIASGDVGLIVGTISVDSTEILFDNLIIIEP